MKKFINLSRETFFSGTVIGGTLENLVEISKIIVFESFKVNFFSAAGVSEAEDDNGEELSELVASISSASSDDDDDEPPPNNSFNLPTRK